MMPASDASATMTLLVGLVVLAMTAIFSLNDAILLVVLDDDDNGVDGEIEEVVAKRDMALFFYIFFMKEDISFAVEEK
jgi:hypothetical protein